MGMDEAQVRDLCDGHRGALLRLALHLTGGDHGRAEDIVQETLVRAWRNPAALAVRPPRPWLFTVCRNLAIDAHRNRQHRPAEIGAGALELIPAGDDGISQVLDTEVISRALARLSRDHRRVITEQYYRGCSVAETAVVLGIPPGTVKSRTHYALRALRLALEEGTT